MSLRSPLYLDIETLLSQADYYEIEVPRRQEVVEKTTRHRTAGGKVNVAGVGGADGFRGTDVEYQSTYSLDPQQKATTSKIIDRLIELGSVKLSPGSDTAIAKDDLLEVEGVARITAASLAGKMFYVFRRLMDSIEGDLDEIFNFDVNALPITRQLKQVYLQNELLPVPVLVELTGTGMSQRVYVNLEPDHFIDAASANRIEGDERVLGSVLGFVAEGPDGFLSAERWLLHDWEYLMRRKLMTQIDPIVKDVFTQLELDQPAEDVHSYITGPAVILNAIAIY